MADEISELETKMFLTNSDAHSLPKIAREYNKILVENISFKELMKAIKNEDGRKILANYGIDPKLGKYHRTYCEICDTCDSSILTIGVLDRIEIIKDKSETKSPDFRPPYIYQIPLSFIPGIGQKSIDKMLESFGTEMNILHKLSFDDIEAVCGTKTAKNIIQAKEGKFTISARWRRCLRKNLRRIVLYQFCIT